MTSSQAILAVSLPVLLGFMVWLLQQLVQRSWDHYEKKYRAYTEVVSLLDSLFEGGDPNKRPEYLKAVRILWLIGSDEVVKVIGELHKSIRTNQGHTKHGELYSQLIKEMRQDLHRRSYLPPGRTRLRSDDFPVESAGEA